ncbi:MAG: type I-E CRISPR-associated protein Cas7/Cse4/CasC [Betaproteobacteria bacterium]|nr:type I-E CRISPR-associated protein Cas7/Cse4/CasC [Betaproteobacteria bacterium]
MKDEFSDESLYGTRTRRVGADWIASELVTAGIDSETATKWSVDLQRAYGVPEEQSDKALLNKQAVHVSPVEQAKLSAFLKLLAAHLKGAPPEELVKKAHDAIKKRDKASDKKKANVTLARELGGMLLVKESTAVDIALFGRMLAAVPAFNFDAAVQVAHAFTVHKASADSDYFTAVDDLNPREEDVGAAHVNETGFGAGVYYLYICVNREQLDQNLGVDAAQDNEAKTAVVALRNRVLNALLNAITKVSPTGKQNSFASRAYASYLLAEKGDKQPRSLALAFVKPVNGTDQLDQAIRALTTKRDNLDKVYGPCASDRKSLNAETGEGSLDELIAFAQAD